MELERAICVVVNAARKTASCFFPLFLSISAKPDLEPQGAAARRGSYFRTFAPCPSRSLRVVPHSEPEAARRAR